MVNEYTGNYKLTYGIHVKPSTDLVNEFNSIYGKYKGIEIYVMNPLTKNHPENPLVPVHWIIFGNIEGGEECENNPSDLEIRVEGDFSDEILKNSADRIGKILGEKRYKH